MIPLALVFLVIAIIFVIRTKEWLLGAFVFVAGILCAAAPFGVWAINNINKFVAWVSGWGIFH